MDGITFEEACRLTPQALSEAQRVNCPSANTQGDYTIIYIIALFILFAAIAIFVFIRKHRRTRSH